MCVVQNMGPLSAKMAEIYRIVTEVHTVGPVMIHSANVESGVNRFEAFFTQNGFYPWKNNERQDKDEEKEEKRAFVNINGGVSMGKAKEAIKILKSDKNYKRDHIGLVLASPKIRTGVTLRHFEAVILDEVDWTIGNREQIIGRVIRHGSHEHSGDPYCNKTVYVYVLCARINPDDVKQLPEAVVKRLKAWINEHRDALKARNFLDDNDDLYTIDERSLRYALERDKDIGKVLRLMKEMALPLNLSQNYFPHEGQIYAGSRLYEYEQNPARIPIPNEYEPLPPAEVPPIPEKQTKYFSTLGTSNYFFFFSLTLHVKTDGFSMFVIRIWIFVEIFEMSYQKRLIQKPHGLSQHYWNVSLV